MNNYKKIEEYLGEIKNHKILSERTLKIKKGILTRFFKTVNKEIDKITDKDISEFLDGFKLSTRDLNIIQLRGFFNWYYKVEKGDKLPSCIKDFELSPERAKRKQQKKDRIVTKEEYENLQEGIKDKQYKAIVEILWRTGARIGEITSMNSNGVKDEGDLIYITLIDSKTKPRDVPIPVETGEIKNILNWAFEYQPNLGNKDTPMFIGKKTGKRMNPKNMGEILTKLSIKILDRRVTCHDFRHTAITRDREQGMPDTFIEAKYGLTKGSRMMAVYDNNGSLQLKNYYLNKMNVTEKRESIDKIKEDRDTLIKIHDKKIKNLEKHIKELDEMLDALQPDVFQNGYVFKRQKLLKVVD